MKNTITVKNGDVIWFKLRGKNVDGFISIQAMVVSKFADNTLLAAEYDGQLYTVPLADIDQINFAIVAKENSVVYSG